MHDALRNPFTVEVGVLLEELPVLDEEGAPRPGREAVLIVADGNARGRRDSRLACHCFLLPCKGAPRLPHLRPNFQDDSLH